MKQDWLDKNLGDKLDDYDSPMDLEFAWESLQTKRQAPRKKNKFLLFWIIFGVFIFGIGGSYFLLNNETDNNHNNILTDIDNNSKIENQRFGNSELSAPTLSDSKNIDQHNVDINKTTETKTIQNSTKDISFENQNYSDEQEFKSGVDPNPIFSKTKNNAVANVIPSNTNFDFPEKSNENFISANQKEAENIIAIDTIIPQKEIQPIAVLFLPSLEMSLSNFSPQENYEILKPSYVSSSTIARIPPTLSTPNYFGVVAGYGIHSKGQVLPQENSLDAITLNMFYEHRFGSSKWFFKTGINYDQFIKKMETSSEQLITQELDDQLIAVNHFQNGTIQEIFGLDDVSKMEKTTSKNFNRYRLISIPMIVGYDLISLNRASLQIEGGVARSILAFHSGKNFDLIDSDFEKQGVWQGLYGLNFNFKTGARTNIFTSFRGNYHFNKIGKSDQLEMEKFRLHQIQVGLRFKL